MKFGDFFFLETDFTDEAPPGPPTKFCVKGGPKGGPPGPPMKKSTNENPVFNGLGSYGRGGHAVKYPARTPGGWVFPVLFLQDSKWVLRVGPAKWFKGAG